MKTIVEKNKVNWMRYRPLYLFVSLLFLASGLYSLFTFGLNPGVEFSGGVEVEYDLEKQTDLGPIKEELAALNLPTVSTQLTREQTFIIKTKELSEELSVEMDAAVKKVAGTESARLRTEMVGPSLSRDLLTKTFYAVAIAVLAIAVWVSFQFKKLTFGIFATLATIHDALIVVGMYSLFGRVWGASADFLFVTAVLTTLSFSVHDTIVVYDRIREIQKKHGGKLYDVSNRALSETMRRSVFNSLTIIFMLASLAFLGDGSIRWFAAALLVGVISGTYSSPFVAVPLLVTWDEITRRLRNRSPKLV